MNLRKDHYRSERYKRIVARRPSSPLTGMRRLTGRAADSACVLTSSWSRGGEYPSGPGRRRSSLSLTHCWASVAPPAWAGGGRGDRCSVEWEDRDLPLLALLVFLFNHPGRLNRFVMAPPLPMAGAAEKYQNNSRRWITRLVRR